MSRSQAAPAQAAGGMDRVIRSLAGVTVAGLAGLAGAISYSHMRMLAEANGQAGWHAHAFPLSVGGVEIVASLVLLADRRTGRRSGWLPWTALAIGTAASLAANVATAGPAPISRVIAGWPAHALLIAVKLLSGMLEHRYGDRPATVSVPILAVPAQDGRDGTGRPDPAPAVPVTAPVPVPDPARPAVPARLTATATSRPATAARTGARPAPRTGTGTAPRPGRTSRHCCPPPAPPGTTSPGTDTQSPATLSPPACARPATPSEAPASHPSCKHSDTMPPPDHPHHGRPTQQSAQAATTQTPQRRMKERQQGDVADPARGSPPHRESTTRGRSNTSA